MPPNVLALMWRVKLNRIPTKSNLRTRNIISGGDNLNCVFCGLEEESSGHLFFKCKFAYSVWMACYKQMNIITVLSQGFMSHIQ